MPSMFSIETVVVTNNDMSILYDQTETVTHCQLAALPRSCEKRIERNCLHNLGRLVLETNTQLWKSRAGNIHTNAN